MQALCLQFQSLCAHMHLALVDSEVLLSWCLPVSLVLPVFLPSLPWDFLSFEGKDLMEIPYLDFLSSLAVSLCICSYLLPEETIFIMTG